VEPSPGLSLGLPDISNTSQMPKDLRILGGGQGPKRYPRHTLRYLL
jgi:hypothetical protein